MRGGGGEGRENWLQETRVGERTGFGAVRCGRILGVVGGLHGRCILETDLSSLIYVPVILIYI